MTDKLSGRIICGVGGLYTVLCDGGKILKCKARGVLRIKKITPLAGDRVTVRRGDGDEMGFFIDSIFPRKTVLDRPPVANIDTVFTVLCPAEPEPSLLGTDKLLCAISAAKITPVVIISKADIAPEKAKALFDIYSKGNYRPIIKALKALLESAGFMWEVERSSEDMYEDDTKYYHKTLCFSIERSENG